MHLLCVGEIVPSGIYQGIEQDRIYTPPKPCVLVIAPVSPDTLYGQYIDTVSSSPESLVNPTQVKPSAFLDYL